MNLADINLEANLGRTQESLIPAQPIQPSLQRALRQLDLEDEAIQTKELSSREISPDYNRIMLAASIVKMIACATICYILLAAHDCSFGIDTCWIIMLGFFQAIRALLISLRITYTRRLGKSREVSEESIGIELQRIQGSSSSENRHQNSNLRKILFRKITSQIACISVLLAFLNCTLVIFVLFGALIYTFGFNYTCDGDLLKTSFTLFMVLEIVWLCTQAVITCCIPNRKRAEMLDYRIIDYSKSLPGDPECAICQVEYKDKDQVIQLICNPKHYFHDECAKKWLDANAKCPMCRAPIKR